MTPAPQTIRSLHRLLLAVCVGLAAYTVYEWTRPYAAPDPAQPFKGDSSGLTDSVITSAYELPPLENFADTLARPLFRSDRRPYTAPQPVPVQEPAPAPVADIPLDEQVALRATIIIGEKRIALLHDIVNDNPLRLSRGERVHGWTLTDVDTNSVALQKDGTVARLALKQE